MKNKIYFEMGQVFKNLIALFASKIMKASKDTQRLLNTRNSPLYLLWVLQVYRTAERL